MERKENGKWRFAVDRGGTFTDVVGLGPDGRFHTLKLLSESPAYADPCIEGIRRVLGLGPDEPLPEGDIASIRFGTTVATNALLERKGAGTALFITRGFRDLLKIGFQTRPELFSLCIERPDPLYTVVVEVDERTTADGEVTRALDPASVREGLGGLQGVEAAAVVFMHSWKNPANELAAGELLRECGIREVHLSHESVNLIKMVTRGNSAVVDAYLGPVMAAYFEGIRHETGAIPIEFIESSGTLAPPGEFRGKSAVFSGPAGGVLALGCVAEEAGLSGAIGFDMGGTSTDVSRYDGGFEKVYEESVSGVELQGESLDIITVASGGGSVLWFDGGRMRVGPDSAGADPGPACYGNGGPLTVTDANLVTGRISPENFPAAFGPDGASPLDPAASLDRFERLTGEINASLGLSLTPEEAALGFLEIANEKMALAIKEISVSRGFDARDYALVSFGGAGGQHACSIAARLGIGRVVVHPLGGLLSAYGIGFARPARKGERTLLVPYGPESHAAMEDIFTELEAAAGGWAEGFESTCEVELRPAGTDTGLTVEYRGYDETLSGFMAGYRRLFGFEPESGSIEAVNLRVEVRRAGEFFTVFREEAAAGEEPAPAGRRRLWYPSGPADAPVYERQTLPAGFRVSGPAVIVEKNSTIVVDPGFGAVISPGGLLTIEAQGDAAKRGVSLSGGPDPVLLEVFNNLFMSTATEMGHTLRKTAHSVNIKERLDFSCAVFDPSGELVANAPHIPVHLGAMADTVKAVMDENRSGLAPGDVYVSNNPYRGGSHLPDVTVVEPVFGPGGEVIFIVAARGHHADIGGKTPGSLPPDSRHIDEEGVLLDGLLVARGGVFRERELREALASNRYPARNMDERVSDIRAQMAACSRGAAELGAVIDRYGLGVVHAYMGFVQKNAEFAVKKALAGFLGPGGGFSSSFEDSLDDGTVIRVRAMIEAGQSPPETVRAVFDFTGTGPEHTEDNLNAPLPVVRAAVLYVLRSITGEDIPLNGGCLRPVEIIVPEGSLLNPSYPLPVASGNVETSQRVVDVLLGALGVAAASQGTMNNLLFQTEGGAPYYETIAGGAGASGGCPGASGVHTHMTNTRITDPEVLEARYSGVMLERFTLRDSSGGEGRWPGGEGVEREIRFLLPARVSVISERRLKAPYGAAGGGAGRPGENILRKSDGTSVTLGHRAYVEAGAGDSVLIRTPGGGGWGKKGA